MEIRRRRFLRLATGAAALPALSRIAWAQNYPAKLVHIIAGAPPGGILDIHARLTGQWLSERLGKPFIIENRAGAGGSIASDSVASAAPDGYTLLLTWAGDIYNTALYPHRRGVRAPLRFPSRPAGSIGFVYHGVSREQHRTRRRFCRRKCNCHNIRPNGEGNSKPFKSNRAIE